MQQRQIQAYVLPKNDEFMNSGLPLSKCRLFKATGFTGSSGYTVIVAEEQSQSIFVTDSRYDLQAGKEVNQNFFKIHTDAMSMSKCITQLGKENVCIDAVLFPKAVVENLQKIQKIVINTDNPVIDQVLESSFEPQNIKFFNHDLTFSGESLQSKVAKVRSQMQQNQVQGLFVAQLEEIAWLLNTRATGQHEFNPLFNSQLVLTNENIALFLEDSICTSFTIEGVEIHPISKFQWYIGQLNISKIGLDSHACNFANYHTLASKFGQSNIVELDGNKSIVSGFKIIKNDVEIRGLRQALKTESAALISFYSQIKEKIAQEGSFHEHQGEGMLHGTRRRYAGDLYLGPSFPAIIGAGPNGAIVHYRPDKDSSRQVTDLSENILIDTGAHYLNGTTDTTRTMVFGACQDSDLQDKYTRVLMGNLDLQETCFPPSKTYGHQLDAFSRRHLWAVGSDYGHGVGHGVSFCGPVHEYPHYAYAKKDGVFLAPGMVITNEPGYYKSGHFGIRVENIMTVIKSGDYLSFDCLTLIPYCRQLIKASLLSQDHKNLINKYYRRIESEITPILERQNDKKALAYLSEQLIQF